MTNIHSFEAPSPRRRTVVKAAAATAVLAPLALSATQAQAIEGTSFQHGVASGDPLPDGVLLWTRVTPSADAVPGSGKGPDTQVSWEVAEDRDFSRIVVRGSTTSRAATDHTIKADVRGLSAGTEYWYRFRSGDVVSPVGRTRTTAAYDANLSGVRFGVVSCANWEAGWFSSYRHLAARTDLDAVLHLGDYIYEYGTAEYPEDNTVRAHVPSHEILTLADYRARHGSYKTDADTLALHAVHPVIAMWDDHEFANDTWAGGAENHSPDTEGDWATRQAAAKQAYFEWMPVRPSTAGTTYRRLRFGKLADLHLLDLRSFRSEQVKIGSGEVDSPERTLTGRKQLDWLKSGLSASDTAWRLVGTSVMISPLAFGSLPAELLAPLAELLGLPAGGLAVNVDQWDGYTHDRSELISHLKTNGIDNTVFLTGDIHMAFANDVPVKAGTYPLSGSVATEFVVTSVTSDNVDDLLNVPANTVSTLAEGAIKLANRHIKWLDMDSHGYGVLDVTPTASQMDYYVVSDRTDPNATASWTRGYRTLDGTQKVQKADAPVR